MIRRRNFQPRRRTAQLRRWRPQRHRPDPQNEQVGNRTEIDERTLEGIPEVREQGELDYAGRYEEPIASDNAL